MRILVFDIWGDYAHFRKYFTTSSPLTFSFPPLPTSAGILGAIYGTEKATNEYLRVFGADRCKIAVRILSTIKKVRMGINLLETRGRNLKLPMSDKNYAPHTQIRTEFVKQPAYRMYVSHQDNDVFDRLITYISEHKAVYTVALGLSELLADFKFIGVYGAELVTDGDFIELSTPIIASNLIANNVAIEPDKKYFKEKMPLVMNSERIVEAYEDIIFEPDGHRITAQIKSYCKLENGENIAFL